MESNKIASPEKKPLIATETIRKVGAIALLSVSLFHLTSEAKDSMADQLGNQAAVEVLHDGYTAEESIAFGEEVEAKYSFPDFIKDITLRNQNKLETAKDMYLGDEEGFGAGNIINIAALATLAGGLGKAQYNREKRREARKSPYKFLSQY